MDNNIQILKKSPIFCGIDVSEITVMLNCLNSHVDSYEKDEYILRPGTAISSMGLLLEGNVLVVQEDFWGNRHIMTEIPPGQIFAESFACSVGSVTNVGVVASVPSSVMWLNVQQILGTCPSACAYHSRLIQNLISVLAQKNLRFNEKLSHMSQRTTREKLLSYLSAEAQKNGTSEFNITFNRQQLADYLAVERSAMSAELSKLRNQGIITFDKSHFNLLKKI